MYITDEEIADRAGLSDCTREEFENKSHLMDVARAQLEQEHLWRVYEVWEEALDYLKIEPKADEIVELLLRGWIDDLDVHESIVCEHGIVYYNGWEITERGNQIMFENKDGSAFFDVDLYEGLKVCERVDQEPAKLVEAFSAELTPVQVIRFKRILHRVEESARLRA